jgi:hypothetical protein
MQYRRMPIEIEAPEGYGYENIECNLSESSFTDQRLADLGISVDMSCCSMVTIKANPP